jgi:polysaccharide pyruvyl transferase WcaK-like protein
MPKITLTNCYQCGNTGDVAIWGNMMRRLSEKLDCEFTLLSQDICKWDMNQFKKFKVKARVGWDDDFIKSQDVFVSQGGGYMIGDIMRPTLFFLNRCQELDKPVYFATQTFVGDKKRETSMLLEKVLSKARLIVSREPKTKEYIKNHRAESIMLPDQVFDVEPTKMENEDTIQMCIRSYNKDDLSQVALLADKIIETMGDVLFVPVGHDGDRDDRTSYKEIKEKMRHKKNVKFIDWQPNAGQIMGMFKKGIVITDRYHGAIYSAKVNTPFVALTPDIDHKMGGLLQLLDYPIRDVLNLNQDVFKKAFYVWKNREKIRKHLKKITPKIIKDSRKVYKLIIDDIS